ncbi:GGDEF domain-containing protein [Neobacillus jeddahensis]|uniref:GGDEF domain-containing protein n=1 Tax=Neobacillus jeddahensis TaxID=1461580 RepID=UPI00069432B4|nr:diguanylate cyclase [Neobacillus jeddahensis]
MKPKFAFVSPPASDEQKQLLEKHLFTENIQRCKLFARIVILFEAILIIMNVSSTLTNQGTFAFNTYFVLYLLLLVMSTFMLAYIRRFEKKTSYTERQYQRFKLGLLSLVNFFLVWGAVVTLVDQKEYGHVMAFAVNFMCVSVLFHASNRTILKLYILPLTVLLIGLPFFQPSNAILMGHYINLSVFLFFCWLASRMLYRSDATNFFTKLLLTETNQSLASKMEENKKINQELAKVNEQLKKLTIIDELTTIPNRRGFQQYIRERLNHTTDNLKLTLMMIDIDAFKLFNDHYGHLEGDHVIKSVAQSIQNCLHSSSSITARFGGEEFVIALFEWRDEEIDQLAEHIREAVFDMKIRHDYSPVTNHVTISIGHATGYVNNQIEVKLLMEQADQALYQSKANGRNRVEGFASQITMR